MFRRWCVKRISSSATGVRRNSNAAGVIDPTEIEWVAPAQGNGASSSGSDFRDILKIDTFAKARVLNFIKRYRKIEGENCFDFEEIIRDGDAPLYNCRIRIPLPNHPSSAAVGQAVACNKKDAEMLAAMHAEQTIDAYGYQIYTLPSMQRKHAEAARLSGRWAPMPEDTTRAFEDIVLPRPFRRVLTTDETEAGAWLLVDTTVSQFRSHPYAITSPCILEPVSLHRIKAVFTHHKLSFERHSSVVESQDLLTGVMWHVATINLPRSTLGMKHQTFDPDAPPPIVSASGKARDRHLSLVLAAMHAELLIDATGAQLFPRDPSTQEIHAKAVHELGRYATDKIECESPTPSASLPAPLKELHVPEGQSRVSIRSSEEEWVRRNVSVSQQATEFTPSGNVDRYAKELVSKYIVANDRLGHQRWQPLLEKVGVQVKAVIVLPVPQEFGVRGGVGLSHTTSSAQELAVNHALDTLCALGIRFWDTDEEFSEICKRRQELGRILPTTTEVPAITPSPPALRFTAQVLQPVATATKSSAGTEEFPQIPSERLDFAPFQTAANREFWDLKPDFKDFILASKQASDDISIVHTLVSPRRVDPTALTRVVSYLASLGKRISDVMVTKKVEESAQKVNLYQAVIHVPLPAQFGDRLAMGVSPDYTEAGHLAAAHMELILDALGVPLYPDAEHQRKHALAAAQLGRKAPFPGDPLAPQTTPSPPYIKRPTSEDKSWIEMVIKRGAPTGKSSDATQPPVASPSTASVLGIPQKVEYINSDEVDLVARNRVNYYLRRARATPQISLRNVVRQESSTHFAQFPVPVPERFGQRIAYGVAPTKKEAENLMYMHAERLLDALGIPIFNLPGLQGYHARRVRALGRWAPQHRSLVQVKSTVESPLPLCIGEALPMPLRPQVKTQANQELSLQEWNAYIESCEVFIEGCSKRDANIAFQNERVPRTGLSIIDDALEEVERTPFDKDIKQKLTQYCFQTNLPYPTYWKYQTVGPISRRVCLTTVEVPGFEHLHASGCAVSKETSSRKAAMHICALLRRMDPDFTIFERDYEESLKNPKSASESGEVSDGTKPSRGGKESTKKRGGDDGAWSSVKKAFTNDGKVRVIELYSVCFGLQPPVVLNKQRIDGNVVSYSTIAELTDEDGKIWTGKSDAGGKKGNAVEAYNDLFDQLQQRAPGFQSLAELVQNHSHLDPEHVVNVTFSDDIRRRMKDIVGRCMDEDKGEDPDDAVATIERDKTDVTTATLTEKLSGIDQQEMELRTEDLKKRHIAKIASPEYQERFATKRKALSIHDAKDEIVETIKKNQVTVICGTTGCGKTTQIPQFILDDATECGISGEVSMIVTQPRRLSAVSIAQRIASERLESVGDTCGYTIRLDSKPGSHINFVTSGVLLRLFHSSPTLDGINYVIIDEIHERDINSDFLLILVRDLIRRRKDIRVILMSATLSSDQFADFFGGAPVINVVGHVHPVKELFLEDVAEVAEKMRRVSPLFQEMLDKTKAQERADSLSNDLDDASSIVMTRTDNSSTKSSDNRKEKSTQKYGFLEATSDIDYNAVQFAMEHALDLKIDMQDSSILVFLPGWDEIVKSREVLGRNSKYHIIALHSSVSQEEQMQCFLPAPEGKVKLILSTNIAESGVTIDDIGIVIDLGRAKEKSYVSRRGRTAYGRNEMGSMSQLVTVYASRANCVQRRGRVGRTRPGVCIRMYSREHFHSLHDFQTPEMLRQPLDALCLQILALGLGDPVDFLRQAIEPPSFNHVESAMQRLNELGGVTRKGYLTPLGLHLAKLPVAPRIGKMILVGAVLRCLDSALTIAACTDTDVYNSSREARDAVRAHREDLSDNTFSDHISSVNGFNYWVTAHYTKSPQDVMVALQERQLSVPQLLTVSRYKKQFFDILVHHGFLADSAKILRDRSNDPTCRGDIFVEKSEYSCDATDVGLVKAMVGSGLFPNICMYRGKKLMRSKLDNRLAPASSSVTAQTDPEYMSSPYFVFEEVVKQSIDVKIDRLILRGLTSVSLWAVLLMGTASMPVTYRDDLNLGIIDDWIPFRASFNTLDLVRKFKVEFSRSMTRKFVSPNDTLNNERLEEFRSIIKELIGSSLRPNDLVASSWVEKGSIVKPITSAEPLSESVSVGDRSGAGESPQAADQTDE